MTTKMIDAGFQLYAFCPECSQRRCFGLLVGALRCSKGHEAGVEVKACFDYLTRAIAPWQESTEEVKVEEAKQESKLPSWDGVHQMVAAHKALKEKCPEELEPEAIARQEKARSNAKRAK